MVQPDQPEPVPSWPKPQQDPPLPAHESRLRTAEQQRPQSGFQARPHADRACAKQRNERRHFSDYVETEGDTRIACVAHFSFDLSDANSAYFPRMSATALTLDPWIGIRSLL